MTSDILGEWDLFLGESGRGGWAGRVEFFDNGSALAVRDADPEAQGRPARVDASGAVLRFELLSAGSSRGNAHHVYEIAFSGGDLLTGTRRRGLLTKAPFVGRRVAVASGPASLADAEAAALAAEAEATAALEAARLAAAKVAAARAAVQSFESPDTPAAASAPAGVVGEVLAILPAPSAPPVPVSGPRHAALPPAPAAPPRDYAFDADDESLAG
ncbi:hypothetical protein [Protaetiibacter intestinalis]|uniref:Uncharacterized protein n=1 Tax=Protaetiibacter intestinalis TaxID=2419774 RepID=A0A387BL57_9MICO|nr:hypothetical protein [Protaetiibacter intestinalis]AYF99240.1 hypothetical protein D7I47_13890 [Protaetiibacter intestinalis]